MERKAITKVESNAGLLRLVADHSKGLSGKTRALLLMAAEEIEALNNFNDELRKVCDLLIVDGDFSHRLAVMLECALLDRPGAWKEAHELLDEYRSACTAIAPEPVTHMGEPVEPPNAELTGAAKRLPVE